MILSIAEIIALALKVDLVPIKYLSDSEILVLAPTELSQPQKDENTAAVDNENIYKSSNFLAQKALFEQVYSIIFHNQESSQMPSMAPQASFMMFSALSGSFMDQSYGSGANSRFPTQTTTVLKRRYSRMQSL